MTISAAASTVTRWMDQWHVPHFEKMLYDQAQLVEAYLIAYQITGRKAFADTARGILDYVVRDMTSPEGGFYSAEDADSYIRAGFNEKAEGAFYVWTAREIEEALGKARAAEFGYVYGVESRGNTSGEGDPHGELRRQERPHPASYRRGSRQKVRGERGGNEKAPRRQPRKTLRASRQTSASAPATTKSSPRGTVS